MLAVGASEFLLVDQSAAWGRGSETFSMSLWLSQKPLVTLECSVPGRKPHRREEMCAGVGVGRGGEGEVVGPGLGRISSFIPTFFCPLSKS